MTARKPATKTTSAAKGAARAAGKSRTAAKKANTAAKTAKVRPASKSSGSSHGSHKTPTTKLPFDAYKGSKPYIFVSYSHKNMVDVFDVIKKLNDSRYRIWFDEGIEPGNEWPEVVGKALLGCSQLVVFMSRAASESRNVRNEINLAFSEGKSIIVIYLERTNLTEGMMLQIGTVQFINRFEMSAKDFVGKLKSVLSNELHN